MTPLLQSVKYARGSLSVLNQLNLPYESAYEPVLTVEDGWAQIREMKVRGAPAIAIVAALSLAVEVQAMRGAGSLPATTAAFVQLVDAKWEHLKTSRPTAVNLFDAAHKLTALVHATAPSATSVDALAQVLIEAAEKMLEDDVQDNKNMGMHGGAFIRALVQQQKLVMLTHCNTGSLATAGYGTALGVIRYLHEQGQIEHVYCTETRPYNQGSRLTAYELVTENIPSTLVTDNMVAALMHTKGVSAIVVGADRVAANGDTANKIGTYQLAVLARHHNVPFFVVAPTTSIDLNIATGAQIPIEERKPKEVIQTTGAVIDPATGSISQPLKLTTVQVGTATIGVWNPAFDVTPAELITGIVTERGVISKAAGSLVFDIPAYLAH